jgi:hypothetical protein
VFQAIRTALVLDQGLLQFTTFAGAVDVGDWSAAKPTTGRYRKGAATPGLRHRERIL